MTKTKITIQKLAGMLESFGLKHSGKALPDLLEQADINEQTHRDFLMELLETEVKGRNERRRSRNYAAAHFPPNIKTLEEFIPEELESGITEGQIRHLKELTWVDACGNLVFAGPPGLGKTMLALGFGLHAINEGYTVCFESMNRFIGILDKADYERKAGFRLKNIRKAQLFILDEIGYTPITLKQANMFYTFITETYEETSMIFTTNKEIPEWAETMGDPVLTSALLERILCGARCFSLKGESYRLKHPELFLG
jgi:DNA replication protein DnaC